MESTTLSARLESRERKLLPVLKIVVQLDYRTFGNNNLSVLDGKFSPKRIGLDNECARFIIAYLKPVRLSCNLRLHVKLIHDFPFKLA